ncbi:hypothetical protein CF133_21840, partial [Aeromonas salmonicida]|uniref:hypothetical protein n=1 Tax=Aeromonas salmonicida TaxID=645 RepID=UPI0019D4F8B0
MKMGNGLGRVSLIAMAVASQMAMAYDYNTQGKEATAFPRAANEKVYQELDFDNKSAFEGADRGFIAPLLNQEDIAGVFSASAMNYVQNSK